MEELNMSLTCMFVFIWQLLILAWYAGSFLFTAFLVWYVLVGVGNITKKVHNYIYS